MGHVGSQPTNQHYVRSDDFVLSHRLRAVVVDVFVKDVVQRADPALVVHRNKVDELVGADDDGVGGTPDTVGPHDVFHDGRLNRFWLGVGVAGHETPQTGRCL